MDEINGYRCSCPPGRAGPRCQEGRQGAGAGLCQAGARAGPGLQGPCHRRPASSPRSDRVRQVLLVAGGALPTRELLGGGLQQLPLPGWPPGLQQGTRGPAHKPASLVCWCPRGGVPRSCCGEGNEASPLPSAGRPGRRAPWCGHAPFLAVQLEKLSAELLRLFSPRPLPRGRPCLAGPFLGLGSALEPWWWGGHGPGTC